MLPHPYYKTSMALSDQDQKVWLIAHGVLPTLSDYWKGLTNATWATEVAT